MPYPAILAVVFTLVQSNRHRSLEYPWDIPEIYPNPAKPEPKFHRVEDMSALRAKTEAGWVLADALVLSGFLFFRYLDGYVISTGGRDLVHLEFFKPEDFSLRSK
uniref:Uncharacterized protein n=1 Tax=Candidatus Kentrum sp. LFY TaxID=2126342 RepID=A0A450UL39_9GAMM|nr:MAG: hypothetical protein BECKLFY1418B_GA0070995_104315 [Candidatus Kentron sp. LFY]